MRLVHVDWSTEIRLEHLHVVLVLKRIEQCWVQRIEFSTYQKHVGGDEAERVFVLTPESLEQFLYEIRFVHQPHSILRF